MSPMATFGLCAPDGQSTERQRAYYETRARAGVGLIKVEATVVHPSGRSFSPALVIDDDRYVPGLARLAAGVKRHGSAIVLQLHHGGRACTAALTGRPPMAPSAVPGPRHTEMPRAMSRAEIDEIVEAFGRAAARARAAGFDGVELQMGASYLLLGFLSPAQNRRQDEYGGDLSGRMRMILEVVARIRRAIGPQCLVGARVPMLEFEEDGLELPEALQAARLLEQAGLDYLDAYVGYGHRQATDSPLTMGCGEAVLADLAAALKATVSLPVMAAGRFLSLAAAETALAAGKIDLAVFGRALLADSELVEKSLRGDEHRVVPCIGCEACRHAFVAGRCFLNPRSGYELDGTEHPAPTSRRVLVVGTGIPGLAFAEVARRRGHAVTATLGALPFGGLLALRARVPGAEEVSKGVAHYRRVLAELDVPVRTDMPPDPFDIVVDARPGAPTQLEIPGVTAHTVEAQSVLVGRIDPTTLGERIAVLGRGILAGEAALFLAGLGTTVTLLASDHPAMADAHPWIADKTRLRLEARGGRILSGVTPLAVEPGCVLARVGSESTRLGPFDAIVTAWGWTGPVASPGGLAVGDVWDALGAMEATRRAVQCAQTV